MNFTHEKNAVILYSKEGFRLAEVTFPYIDEKTVDINHTFVDTSLRGQGIAGRLMAEVITELENRSLKAVLSCSYAKKWFEKHPEYSHLKNQDQNIFFYRKDQDRPEENP